MIIIHGVIQQSRFTLTLVVRTVQYSTVQYTPNRASWYNTMGDPIEPVYIIGVGGRTFNRVDLCTLDCCKDAPQCWCKDCHGIDP